MKHRILCTVILGFCAGQAAWADLTMRYTLEFQVGSFLPAQAVDAMKRQFGEMPKDSVVQIKGRKVYTSMGGLVMVADYAKGVVILMDPKSRRFAVTPISTYADKVATATKIPEMPLQARQMLENMKFDMKVDRTGQVATIQGIRGEENLVTIAVEMPTPSGPGMQMRTVMHQWHASPDEVKRTPALQELEMYSRMPKAGMDPAELMTKMLSSLPGVADKVRAARQQLSENGGNALLRIQASVYMPSMAQLLGGPGDQPFMQYSLELAEISTASLPEARFEPPADYQSAPFEELIAMLFPAPKPALAAAGPKAETPAPGQTGPIGPIGQIALPPGPPPAGTYRVGGGVMPPQLLAKTEPVYTEEARADRIQGTVLLFVVVGPDGLAQRMKVLRSLDPGLDQKAIEAVGTWKFKPGTKDGHPVAVEAQIEVNFRLMD